MTLISHISQAECIPACSPAPATTQHFNYGWHLHQRLWVSKNLSFCQNPGPLPPTDVEWRVLGQGKVPRHWAPSAWRTQAVAEGHCPKEVSGGGEGDTEWATSEWDSQFRWKALEQNNVALQRRRGLGGRMQSWAWARAFHHHLMSNIRSFSALATHYFCYHISPILAVLQMMIESRLKLSGEKEKGQK